MPLPPFGDMEPAEAKAWRRAGMELEQEAEWWAWERTAFLARAHGATGVRNPIPTPKR